MNNTYSKFEIYYPFLAEHTVSFEEINSNTILAMLDDSSKMIYNSLDNIITNLKNDRPLEKDFGIALNLKLKNQGISQITLSRMTGISRISINSYCNGSSVPSYFNAKKIADALECSLDEFSYY